MTKKSAATTSEATKAKPATQPVQVATAKRMFLAAKAAVKLAKAKFRQARKTAKRLKKLLRSAKQNAVSRSKRGVRNQRRAPKVKPRSGPTRAVKPTTHKVSRPRIPTRKKTSSPAGAKPVVTPSLGEKLRAHKPPLSTKPKVSVTPSAGRSPSPPRSAVSENPQTKVVERPSEAKEAIPAVATMPAPAE